MEETQTSHFWLGHFPSGERVAAYFTEVYDDEDENREHTPLSEFARDQGESWYDHDCLEYGFNPSTSSVEELVTGYSYHEQYAPELTQRAAQLGLGSVNMFVFINESEIAQPQSVEADDYWLRYVGTMTYRI